MNILGLIASGRKLGNSEILAKEMLSTLNGEKRLLRLSELSIKPCLACYACLPKDKPCVIEDDFDFLLDQIEWADVIVLTSPCYFLGEHNSIKLISDRLLSVLNEGERFRDKKCVVAVTYGVSGWQGYAREAIMNFTRFLHLDLKGTLLVHAANPGEVAQPDILTKAHKLAGKLMNDEKEEEQGNSLLCPGCGSSLLQIDKTGYINCVMCGMTGQINSESGRYVIDSYNLEHYRYSQEGMREHGDRLESIKASYIEKRKALMVLRKNYKDQDVWWIQPTRIDIKED